MEPRLTSTSISSPYGVAGAAITNVFDGVCAKVSREPIVSGRIVAAPAAATPFKNRRRPAYPGLPLSSLIGQLSFLWWSGRVDYRRLWSDHYRRSHSLRAWFRSIVSKY